MAEKEFSPRQIEMMALVGPLIAWNFGEVFVDGDKERFDKFVFGVRLARQNQFALRIPMQEGSFYMHYTVPSIGEAYDKPRIWMSAKSQQERPEELVDILVFDLGQTSFFQNDEKDQFS